jgi:cytosolic carboxypeptidase protein 5
MSEEVYFHRELLGYSKELRNVELITITAKTGESNQPREDKIEGLFPTFEEGSAQEKLFSRQRCLKFNKPCVFLSARVHPGEV